MCQVNYPMAPYTIAVRQYAATNCLYIVNHHKIRCIRKSNMTVFSKKTVICELKNDMN